MIANIKLKSNPTQRMCKVNGVFHEVYHYNGWIHIVGSREIRFSYQQPKSGDDLDSYVFFKEVVCVYPIKSMNEFKLIIDAFTQTQLKHLSN